MRKRRVTLFDRPNSCKTLLDSGKKAAVVRKCGNNFRSRRYFGSNVDVRLAVEPSGKSTMEYLQLTPKFYPVGRRKGGD